MKKVIKGKQILIIAIISLVATGVILSSNWSYFIQNNDNNNTALNSYQINTGSSNYIKFNQEEENIMFQINVLKSAISRNNIMYRQYNNIFKSNISYVHLQKNIIRNRIKIANSSIKHEIDVLDNMKSIIHNHPYNYLKFFQGKNYTLPQIVSQNGISSSSSIGNITTNIKNINKSNASVNSIAYQSEEAAIGAKAISSIVSSAKTLIFSKSHFDYSNLYYFSKESNNLSTINKLNNIKKTTKTSNSYAQNRFINNSKYNSYNKSNKSKHRFIFFSNSASIISTVINDPALIAVPVAGAALVSTAVGIGYFVYRYKKMVSLRQKQNNVPGDGVVVEQQNTNDGAVIHRTNANGGEVVEQSVVNNVRGSDTFPIIPPQARLVSTEIHTNSMDLSSSETFVDALEEQSTGVMKQPKINKSEETLSTGATSYTTKVQSPQINNIVDQRAQKPKVKSKFLSKKKSGDEVTTSRVNSRWLASESNNDKKVNIARFYPRENHPVPIRSKWDVDTYFHRHGIHSIMNAKGRDSSSRGSSIAQSIYWESDEAARLKYSDFKEQLINYAKLKTGEIDMDINMEDVAAHISVYIGSNPKHGDSASLSIIKDATDFSRADKTGLALREKTTTHGWFQMPIFEKFDASDLSQKEMNSIQEQLVTLINISNSLPYTAKVQRGYSFVHTRNISDEILGDLNEVTTEFQNHLLNIHKEASESNATNRTIEEPEAKAEATKDINFVGRYKTEAKLLKSDVYDVSHLKTHGWNLEEEFQHIANIDRFRA